MFKKENTMRIVLPTLYNGEVEPEEPREGDIWQNTYTCEVSVYLGYPTGKWFTVKNGKQTDIIHKKEIEQRKKAEETELEKYKNFFKEFNKLLKS